MYLDIDDMLISDKEIKKITYNGKNFVMFMSGADNPKSSIISAGEYHRVIDRIKINRPDNICKIDNEIYFVRSIYDFEKKGNYARIIYPDGTDEIFRGDNIGKYDKIHKAYKNYCKNNQEEFNY